VAPVSPRRAAGFGEATSVLAVAAGVGGPGGVGVAVLTGECGVDDAERAVAVAGEFRAPGGCTGAWH
jgi:hypothetical protein